MIPEQLNLGQVQKVLQNLLRERVSIRDMLTVIETLADHAAITKSPEMLTEFVRQALSHTITKQNMASDGKLYVMMLDREIEDVITQATQFSEQGTVLALEPTIAQRVLKSLQKGMEQFTVMQLQPIVACLPTIRGQLRRLTEKFFPNLVVLSHNEITSTAEIETVGVVRLNDAN